jgi:hypothetical protein
MSTDTTLVHAMFETHRDLIDTEFDQDSWDLEREFEELRQRLDQ